MFTDGKARIANQALLKTEFMRTLLHRRSWCIDPFGESPTMPYVLQHFGLKSLVIQRTHYSVKKYLAKHKQLEFRWRQLWGKSLIVLSTIPYLNCQKGRCEHIFLSTQIVSASGTFWLIWCHFTITIFHTRADPIQPSVASSTSEDSRSSAWCVRGRNPL